MSRRWVLLGGGIAAVLTVVIGVATNQVLNNRGWSWPWFAAAVAFAAITAALDRRMAAAQQPRAKLRPDLTDEKGQPRLVSEVTPRQLGVHLSRFGSHGDSPYVKRDVDKGLGSALHNGDRRLVVIHGPRLAGATSTLAQAAQTHLAGHRILAFVDDPRLTVAQMVASGRRWAADGPGAVLWLDDLTPDRLEQLADALGNGLPRGMWILATVHGKDLNGFRVLEYVRVQLDSRAVMVRLDTISGRERDALRAEDTYAALRPVLDAGGDLLMGRLMVALDQIQIALTPGRESVERIALLRAVTDWYRITMPTLLTRRVLEDLYSAYWREFARQDHDRPASVTRFERALTWATAKSSRRRPQLVDLERVGRDARYVPHPLLAVVGDDSDQPGAWPVPDALWDYADRILRGDQRRDVGYTALDRGAFPHARRLLGHADAQINPAAMLAIAIWLQMTGDSGGARRWYSKVIATHHPDQEPEAMTMLAFLEWQQGNLGEARRWFGEAIATGHAEMAPRAMFNLGLLEEEQGNVAETRRWYGEAIVTGHADYAPQAMVELGLLEEEQGSVAEARRRYREAIATGHADMAPQAMVNLGNLEAGERNIGEACRWYREAIAAGHADYAPKAMLGLGFLEKEQGSAAEARRWYGEAIKTGHANYAPVAMLGLGVLEDREYNIGEARRWFGEAIATGHAEIAAEVMSNLGNLELDQDNVAEARRWYGEAIATGHAEYAPQAMFKLAYLDEKQGDVAGARRWYGQAISTGHADVAPQAMVNLGNLNLSQGEMAQACSLWESAIATGHAYAAGTAMVNLGNVERQQGNVAEARRWYEEAIKTGHPDRVADARRGLADLERHEKEVREGEQSGRLHWLAYADPKLMERSGTRPEPDQPATDEEKPSPQ